jgi:hypothetical protein
MAPTRTSLLPGVGRGILALVLFKPVDRQERARIHTLKEELARKARRIAAKIEGTLTDLAWTRRRAFQPPPRYNTSNLLMPCIPINGPRERIMGQAKFAGLVVLLGPTLVSSLVSASEYCTKDQYQHDHALIENAISSGTLVKGPKGLRDSILVQEGMWFGMNYPQQIVFMQSIECAMSGAGGKKLLYMDVRSLGTGKLLATWSVGTLNPAESE